MTDPHIIRQNQPHEVVVGDGSQVAASRSQDAQGPQVRKVLASDDPSASGPDFAPVIPPSIARSAQEEGGPVFERQATAAERTLAVPEASRPQAQEAIVFERSLQDGETGQAPPGQVGPDAADGTPHIERSLQDRRVGLPEALAAEPGGPAVVFERASHDRFVAAPEGSALPDNFQTLPSQAARPNLQTLPPEGAAAPAPPAMAPPAVAPPVAAPPVTAPPAPAPAAPPLPPVATEVAQSQILEAAKEIQERVEETLGAADPSWVEMDFPARLIRLKIENDKVRTKLERLEAMALKI
jgi:hypothetical protein